MMKLGRLSVLLSVAIIFYSDLPTATAQHYFEDTGFNQLVREYGTALETGAGISVGIVEAPISGNFQFNTTNSQFSGKNIVLGSPDSGGNSSHALGVATRQFGNSGSFSPGVIDVTIYQANEWISQFLGQATGQLPQSQRFSVINHSYIGFSPDSAEINRRIDFLTNTNNVTNVVGTNNGRNNDLPSIYAQSYNSIVVGRTDGNHASGLTRLNGSGRTRPDIVAPAGSTSNATPLVSSAATLIRARGQTLGSSSAIQNEVTKAVLLAGATKDDIAGVWANSSSRPLDPEFGAGELNVYNSYQIISGGEYEGSLVEPIDSIGNFGFDYREELLAGEEVFYGLSLDSNVVDASFVLAWNADISDSSGALDFDTIDLADLNLRLYDSNGQFLDSILAESISSVDNVEHLFFENLSAGEYTLGIENASNDISTDFAFAFRLTTVPEPSSACLLILAVFVSGLRRPQKV